jgi:hypothetical protein
LEVIFKIVRLFDKLTQEIFYIGNKRFCPLCKRSFRRFIPYGHIPRDEAKCPNCGALERHRLVWLYIERKTELLHGKVKRMLHVAPEPCLQSRFSQILGDGYLTADLSGDNVMLKMDVCNIDFPDHSFDAIYCSHVLEHVEDDKLAMREFFRVLKNDGWSILLVPIMAETTFEDASITDPMDRLKVFGHEEHVRAYGMDYIDRLVESGFKVETTEVCDLVDENEAIKFGLTQTDDRIFFCTK